MNYVVFLWEPVLWENQVPLPFILLDNSFPNLGQSPSMYATITTLHIFRILSVQLSCLWHSVLQILSILLSPVSHLCLLNSENLPYSICVTPSQPRNILMAVSGGGQGLTSFKVYCPLLPFIQWFEKFCFIFNWVFFFRFFFFRWEGKSSFC